MEPIKEKCIRWIQDNNYTPQGKVYAKPLVMTYPLGKISTYLGVYIPISK